MSWYGWQAEDIVADEASKDWIAGQHVYLHCYSESPGGHPFTSKTFDEAFQDSTVDN